ncbi:hypothetical protein [Streptomyces sp. NPDC048442]|uniref:hypothetical protein n=1 Tax=Streptomyces sp. NPDC048442 TaxID=3154823 RepID=UPI00342F6D4B
MDESTTAADFLATEWGDPAARLPLLSVPEARAVVLLLAELEEQHPAAAELRGRIARRLPS